MVDSGTEFGLGGGGGGGEGTEIRPKFGRK